MTRHGTNQLVTRTTPAQEQWPDSAGTAPRPTDVAHGVATHTESESHMNDPTPPALADSDAQSDTQLGSPRGAEASVGAGGPQSSPGGRGTHAALRLNLGSDHRTQVRAADRAPTAPAEQPDPRGFWAHVGGRVLVGAADEAGHYAALLEPTRSGLVVSGKSASHIVRGIHTGSPGLVLAIDPWQAYTAYATADAPFVLDNTPDGQETLIDPPTLSDVLDSQRGAGATFAVTPTGVMRAGDNDPLKEAVRAINREERDDAALLVPLEPACLLKDNLPYVIGILQYCEHPVAVSIADTRLDPYTKALTALRELVASLPNAMVWRTDLAGLDLMAHGAKVACIGDIPSRRAADTPGKSRYSVDPNNKFPYVLMRDLARWRKSNKIQRDWYARIESPGCPCIVCRGAKVDRYNVSDESRLEAHKHNVAVLMEILREAPAYVVGAKAWWAGVVADAVTAHTALGATIGGRVTVPACITAYGKD